MFCYLKVLSKEESRHMDKEIVEWVKWVLKKPKYRTHVYNILNQLKNWIRDLEYENQT